MIGLRHLILFLGTIAAMSSLSAAPKRIFVQKLDGAGNAKAFAESFRQALIVAFVEEGNGDWHVLSDEDIKLMYYMAADMEAGGCSTEAEKNCLAQIGYAMDADNLIYGSVSESGGQFEVNLTSLGRNRKSDDMTKGSVFTIKLYKDQAAWYAVQSVKKLVNGRYRIPEDKVPQPLGVQIDVSQIKGLDIQQVKIKTTDAVMQQMVDYLKGIVTEGDQLVKDSKIGEGEAKYLLVLEKLNNNVTEEYRNKLTNFEKIVKERLDILKLLAAKTIEAQGDEYYIRNEFEQASLVYMQAANAVGNLNYPKAREAAAFTRSIERKKEVGHKTAINFLRNEVRSKVQQINYLTLIEQFDASTKALGELRQRILASKIGNDDEILNQYNGLAKLFSNFEKLHEYHIVAGGNRWGEFLDCYGIFAPKTSKAKIHKEFPQIEEHRINGGYSYEYGRDRGDNHLLLFEVDPDRRSLKQCNISRDDLEKIKARAGVKTPLAKYLGMTRAEILNHFGPPTSENSDYRRGSYHSRYRSPMNGVSSVYFQYYSEGYYKSENQVEYIQIHYE